MLIGIVLHAVVCRRLQHCRRAWTVDRRAGHRARGRSGGRHSTAGQYGCVPLGRHLVIS